jgi:hypothetical protein
MKKALFFLILILSCSPVFAQDMGSLISPGELSSVHAKIEGLNNCTKCHTLGGGVPDSRCLDCHDKLAKRIDKKEGFHARVTEPCMKCHTEHKGRSFKIFSLDAQHFDHSLTAYPLVDKHQKVECKNCHKKKGTFVGLSTECIACHKDYHDNQLGKTCANCHEPAGWKVVRKFNHDKASKFPLKGKHRDVECAKCHVDNNYRIKRFDRCLTCHKDPHKGKPACAECHTEDGWKKVKIDHSKTRFPLTNKHNKVPCGKCHIKNRLRGIPFKTCDSSNCHRDVHKKQFKGERCESCHNTKGFKPSIFRHNSPDYSGFRLDGKHNDVPCGKCHVKGKYKPIPYKTCDGSGCHKDVHKGQFKEQICETCHNTKGFKPSLFKHDSPTYKGFKLDGKHVDVACAKCHLKGKYKPLPQECAGCHGKDDVHKKELGENCAKCHVTADWKKLFFDHDTQSKFPLTGKHKDTECEKCHGKDEKRKFKIEKSACRDCHEDYHKGEFKEACSECHTTSDWEPKGFDHAGKTGFRLEGVHTELVCADCHLKKGEFTGANRFCYGCHIDPHFNQFGTFNCGQCHTQSSWNPLRFDHSQTNFPLFGNHRVAECEDCHKNQLYRNTPTACIACHGPEYNGALNHIAMGYSTDCRECHGTTFITWEFNHAKLSQNAPCATCHLPDYPPSHTEKQFGNECALCHKYPTWDFDHARSSAGKDCSDCHLANRPQDHVTKNFSTKCSDCHAYPTWDFDHAKVSAGKTCSDCHLSDRPQDHATKNFSTTCSDCHAYPTWDFDHAKISAGKACSDCHLTDRPQDHVANNFSTTCTDCHAYPTWDFDHAKLSAGKACSDCHLTDRPQSHVTNNTSTACETCHTYPSWDADHAKISAGKACSDCHLSLRPQSHVTNNYSLSCDTCHDYPTWTPDHAKISAGKACSDCHLSNRPQSHVTNNYSTDCSICHAYPSWTFDHAKVSSGKACSDCHLSNRPQSHITNNYSTDCSICHAYPTWSFDHAKVSSGKACSDCHLSLRPQSHITNNYSTDCSICHAYPSWTFDHAKVSSGKACSDCHLSLRPQSHITNNYSTDCSICHAYPTWDFVHPTVSTACSTCHINDDPSAHEQFASRFGTSCQNCHTYPSWLPASFNHSFSPFRIPHRGYGQCVDCHPVMNYGNSGYCIECHSSTGARVHNSNTNAGCLTCHPTGQGD